MQKDSAEARNHLIFRNYLNAFPSAAKQYEALKRRQVPENPADSGKNAFIQSVLRRAMVWSFLGKKVHIEIDRPVGYVHEKGRYTLTYPLNYGYIPGVLGGDGEELDVYLLGVPEPVQAADCRVIGVVHRKNDVEDKLIAAPLDMDFSKEEMAAAVHFQERWYDSYVITLAEANDFEERYERA